MGTGLAVTPIGVPPDSGGRWVRRDEIRGPPASSADKARGAADEDDPVSGLSTVIPVLAGTRSAAGGGETTFVGAGGELPGSAGRAGAGALAAEAGALVAGVLVAGAVGAGAADGIAFRFRTDRRPPEDGASSEASSIADS